jgi:hypothetical protein
MSKKSMAKLDKKSYNEGVEAALKAVSKFCLNEEKAAVSKMKTYLKQKRYTELLEKSIEKEAYNFLGEGLRDGFIDLEVYLEE